MKLIYMFCSSRFHDILYTYFYDKIFFGDLASGPKNFKNNFLSLVKILG